MVGYHTLSYLLRRRRHCCSCPDWMRMHVLYVDWENYVFVDLSRPWGYFGYFDHLHVLIPLVFCESVHSHSIWSRIYHGHYYMHSTESLLWQRVYADKDLCLQTERWSSLVSICCVCTPAALLQIPPHSSSAERITLWKIPDVSLSLLIIICLSQMFH